MRFSWLTCSFSHSQDRIVKQLDQIREIKSEEFQNTMITDRSALVSMLEKLGLSNRLLDDESFFIDNWLKENFPDSEEARNLMPDYEQPVLEALGAEKSRTADPVENGLTSVNEPIEPVFATSSTAQPPPYTFDDGSDRLGDHDFLEHIREATEIEALSRQKQHRLHPEAGPHPWGWLPVSLQQDCSVMKDVIPMLEPNSFSVMAYETSPRCAREIDRLTRLLQSFANSTEQATSDSVVDEALRSLNVMSSACKKFTLLADISRFPVIQDGRAINKQFSDLDSLDFEHSTAYAVDQRVTFPEEEFLLAQKCYYHLLTYMMGFLNVLSRIYPGMTYSPRVIESFWAENDMAARTAWIEKQLAGWGGVEEAIIACRAWHSTRSGLRSQALMAMKDWQAAKVILSGNSSESPDVIELRVVSASALPKSSFRLPSTYVKVSYFGTNKFGGPLRAWEGKTELVQKTQDPVWEKSFPLKIPANAKMIDIEIYDRFAKEKMVAKTRSLFSFIPGVEAKFADRSLLESVDGKSLYPNSYRFANNKSRENSITSHPPRWEGQRKSTAYANNQSSMAGPAGQSRGPGVSH